MKTLSLYESSDLAKRADNVCRIVESHADGLRSARAGRRFSREGVSFRLCKADRNTLYRIDDGSDWFLKMPRNGSPAAIEHEILGAEVVRDTVGDYSEYRHPEVIRASVSHAYHLARRIPGRMLNWSLLRTVVLPFAVSDSALRSTFSRLGGVLARFHQSQIRHDVATNRPVAAAVNIALKNATRKDETCELIERHRDRLSLPLDDDAIAHGGVHIHNVLSCEKQVSLIDFENCGQGSAYDDLSLICSQLTCMGLAAHVPARRVIACRDALLESYNDCRGIDREVLGRTITARVCGYYVTGFCSGTPRPTVLGVPLLRGHVRSLVESLLSREPAVVLRMSPAV